MMLAGEPVVSVELAMKQSETAAVPTDQVNHYLKIEYY